jgi:hypothetical protein
MLEGENVAWYTRKLHIPLGFHDNLNPATCIVQDIRIEMIVIARNAINYA